MRDNNEVSKFIEAETLAYNANTELRKAKEELIHYYVDRGDFDMFTLDVKRVYRANGIPPKHLR